MCLSIPSQITAIDIENHTVVVDTLGVQREASTHLIDEALKIGDFVLIHIGFVMTKINEQEALESIALYQEILETQDEWENSPCP